MPAADNRSSIQTFSVTTPRLRIAGRRHGDDDGLPMLLLHGGLATSRWWEPFLNILPDEILAFAPDLRGCGDSDHPESGFTVGEMTEDIVELLEMLGWDEADVVGHAYGAALAAELALAAPHRVRTLTLVSPPPIEGVYTPVDALMLLDSLRNDRDLLAQALVAVMPTFDHTANSAYFDKIVADAASLAPLVFTEFATALAHWNRAEDARRLTLPTLLVWGDQDIIVERDALTRTLIAIPGASNLEILRGVGHSPMIEAPTLLAERLIEFITDDFDDYDEARSQALDAGSSG